MRDDLALMISGTAVPAKIREYAAVSMNLQTKDEIFSAMVVYGFLSYEKGKVFIPNKELMDKFADVLMKEPALGYVYRLAKESERMLKATLSGDTKTMVEILEDAIQQIKDRKYAMRFSGKAGEKRRYTGRVLAVGISYDKRTKKHNCKIEVLSQ